MTLSSKPSSFTLKYDNICRAIVSDISVSEPYDTDVPPPGVIPRNFIGLWDTGATGTCISKNVAEQLRLAPVGTTVMHTAAGTITTNRYIVNIELPNEIAFPFVEVYEAELHDTDVLIGMDIITSGDIALTNPDMRTTFTFRQPSIAVIDFTL